MDDVVVLRGGEVLVSGYGVLWFATMLERTVQASRINGGDGGLARDYARAFSIAASRSNAFGHESSKVSPTPVPASSSMADPITAAEAAGILGTSVQNVTGLCRNESLETGRRLAGRWWIERAEVLARRERRAA